MGLDQFAHVAVRIGKFQLNSAFAVFFVHEITGALDEGFFLFVQLFAVITDDVQHVGVLYAALEIDQMGETFAAFGKAPEIVKF